MLGHPLVGRPVGKPGVPANLNHPSAAREVSIDRLRALALAAITESRSPRVAPVRPALAPAAANFNGAASSTAA